MFSEICCLTDLQSWKHFFGIRSLAVIRSKHIRRIGFPESARTTVTDIGIHSIQNSICVLQQSCFIHIYPGIQCYLKCAVIRIYKSSHLCPPLSETIYYIPVLLALQYIVIYSASSMAVVTECDILSFCLIKKRLRSNVNIQSIHWTWPLLYDINYLIVLTGQWNNTELP